MLGEHDYQDKRWMYEESMRMPFLVRYPKTIKAGIRSDAMVENVDYAPTMLDFAGAETPSYMQGASFQEFVKPGRNRRPGRKKPTIDTGCTWLITTTRAWRYAQDHKLIYYYGCDYQGENQTPPAWELYDLTKDPHELNNVYDDPSYRTDSRPVESPLRSAYARTSGTTDRTIHSANK